jgi:Tol biopolymer transport system component
MAITLGAAVMACNLPVGGKPEASGKIVFQSDRAVLNEYDIFVINADGTGEAQLTDAPGNDTTPEWSPDGKQIVFTSQRDDGVQQIYVMDADGGNQTRINPSTFDNTQPSWSPDGSKIAFVSRRDGNTDIYVMNADGSDEVRLTDGPGMDDKPKWSPDGTTIAYVSTERDDLYFGNIWTMRADGSEQTQITTTATPSQLGYDSDPAWSPDGEHIMFSTTREGPYAIYVMAADGSDQKRIIEDSTTPGYSPDGAWVVHQGYDVITPDIYIARVDGSDRKQLTTYEWHDENPDWTE